jgi:hypothetical protein
LRGQWTKWEHDNLRSVPLENWEYRPPSGDDGPKVETDTMQKPRIIRFVDAVVKHPKLRPYIVDKLLRRGETMNLIARPKKGKSFLSGNLAWSVATGRHWLGFSTTPGRVLILDNELHVETLTHRLNAIADAMMVANDDRSMVDFVCLRGWDWSIDHIKMHLDIQKKQYDLVILDALYRAIPDGVSENDNSGMMKVYNSIDRFADQYGFAYSLIHHTSKGNQTGKDNTDVGAGAGSIARATDTHVTIRDHESDGLSVLAVDVRSSAPVEPLTLRFDFPLWHAVAADPVLKDSRPTNKQDDKDKEARALLLKLIPDAGSKISERQLREKSGMGKQRLDRLLAPMVLDGLVTRKRGRAKGAKQVTNWYFRPNPV